MSNGRFQPKATTEQSDEPIRTGWVLHQGGELGWTLREVELFDSDVEKHTVRRWPAEILSVVLAVLERRISRKLVERIAHDE